MRIPFDVPDRGERPFDVVGLGLNSIDMVAVVAEHPEPNSKQPLQRFARLPGGETATAMAVCARLGWDASYIGSFGDDELGRTSAASLVTAGVSIVHARIVAGATNQFAMILVDARSGDRTVLWDRDPKLTLKPDEVLREPSTAGRLLVVDSVQTAAATRATTYARAAGIPTILDIDKVRPGTQQLLRQIDVIIGAESLPSELTGYDEPGRAIAAIASEYGAAIVCVTLGDKGSLARVGGMEIHTPAFAVDCVDTTGAGDAFRGGFAAGCLDFPDGDIEDVLAYANAVAALNCRGLGARGGMPTRGDVEALLVQIGSYAVATQPLEDLAARLERERLDADRRYNDALTALDQAVGVRGRVPEAPAALDATSASALNGTWDILPDGAPPIDRSFKGRLRGFIWRLMGPPLETQKRFNALAVDAINRQTASMIETTAGLAAITAALAQELEALATVESLLVQSLQTVTEYVDSKDRAALGGNIPERLGMAEQRIAALKRELEAAQGSGLRAQGSEGGASSAGSDVFSRPVDSLTYVGFEDRFRGPQREIAARVADYLPILETASDVVDIGCGRGELLRSLKDKGVRARGVDANAAMVELCRSEGLDVQRGDALSFLESQADGSIGGLVAIQVVEHFEPGYLAKFLETAFHKMRAGAPLILETINPSCWMAFFETYIRDLTHQRPLHPDTLRFLVESTGFTAVDVQFRQPVGEGDRLQHVKILGDTGTVLPRNLAQLADAVNAQADKLNARLFSYADYAVIARR